MTVDVPHGIEGYSMCKCFRMTSWNRNHSHTSKVLSCNGMHRSKSNHIYQFWGNRFGPMWMIMCLNMDKKRSVLVSHMHVRLSTFSLIEEVR